MSAVDGTAAARLARKKVFFKSHNSNRSKRDEACRAVPCHDPKIIADSRILRIIQTFEIPS